MARIIPEASQAFRSRIRPQQRFRRPKPPKRSGLQDAADIMRIIRAGTGTARDVFSLGKAVYEAFEDTEAEKVAAVQKEALEGNEARRQQQLAFAGREIAGTTDALAIREDVAQKIARAQGEAAGELEAGFPVGSAAPPPPAGAVPSGRGTTAAMDAKAASLQAAESVPMLDVLTLKDVMPRMTPTAQARMRKTIRQAVDDGRVRVPANAAEAEAAREEHGPVVRRATEEAILRGHDRAAGTPVLEQLDQLIGEETYIIGDLELLASRATSIEEVRKISEAADNAIDLVPSGRFPGATDRQGRDLMAIIEGRRRVLGAAPKSFGGKELSLKEQFALSIQAENLKKKQFDREKREKRGKGKGGTRKPKDLYRRILGRFGIFVRKGEGGLNSRWKTFREEANRGGYAEMAGGNARQVILDEFQFDIASGKKVTPAQPKTPKPAERSKQHKRDVDALLKKRSTKLSAASAAVNQLSALNVTRTLMVRLPSKGAEMTSSEAVALARKLIDANTTQYGEDPAVDKAALKSAIRALLKAIAAREQVDTDLSAAVVSFVGQPSAVPPSAPATTEEVPGFLEKLFEGLPNPADSVRGPEGGAPILPFGGASGVPSKARKKKPAAVDLF